MRSSALAAAGIRRLTVYRLQPEDASALGASVPGITVTVGVLSEGQIEAYLELRPDTRKSEVVSRQQAGALCVAAWSGERLVAARWLQTGRIEIVYLGFAVGLAPGVWYAYDAYTEPAERRRGVSGMVTAALVRHALDLDATSVINAVLPENRSGRGLARRRSQRLGVLRSLRVGPWRVVGWRLPGGYLGAPGPRGEISGGG